MQKIGEIEKNNFSLIEYKGGLHIVDTVLYLDCLKKKELNYISSAGIFQNIHPKIKILCTEITARLIKKKFGFLNALTLPFGKVIYLGKMKIELLPSGFIPGSSQLFVEIEDKKILYIANIAFDNILNTKVDFRKCDILVFNISSSPVPEHLCNSQKRKEIFMDIITHLMDSKITPVILASSPGSAQEIIAFLSNYNYPIRVHQSIWRMNKIYREIGISLKPTKLFKNGEMKGEIIIFPPYLKSSPLLLKIKNKKFIYVSEPPFKEEGIFIPFAEGANFYELLEILKICSPDEIYIAGKYSQQFSSFLNGKGYKSILLYEKEQLMLF